MPGGGLRGMGPAAQTVVETPCCPGFGDRCGCGCGFGGVRGFVSHLFMLVKGLLGAGFDGGSG